MKFTKILMASVVAWFAMPASATPIEIEARATVEGFDISHYQTKVNFAGAFKDGLRFVMIKATEGTTFIDPEFSSHYIGATKAGFIRGGYHFARPGVSCGAVQAWFFAVHGGGWSPDGITLPGMLDLEAGCSGLSKTAMVNWIKDFSDTYNRITHRYPIIYSTRSWWETCTGDSTAFKDTSPLDLVRWASTPGPIPGGWPFHTFWQYNDHNKWGGDSELFNGSLDQLKKLAKGS